jgi:maltose/moltooligosaccharide transporter
VTGLLVQPVIGYLSDRTWSRFGRRRPYFLAGAIVGTLALLALPNSGLLWLAVPIFWILDIALNVSMEPFRAFIGDMLPDEQRTTGYAVQTIFIGTGALLASAAPYVLTHAFGLTGTAPPGVLPATVKLSFYIGAFVFLAAVAWTVCSTREYSPQELAAFEAGRRDVATDVASVALGPRRSAVRELLVDIAAMPSAMRRLAAIQFFSWCAFFILWIYATPVIAFHHFAEAKPGSAAYNEAGDWIGILFAVYNGAAALYAFALPSLARRLGKGRLHALNLVAGSAGFAGFLLTRDSQLLVIPMVGIGIAWASVLAMPYALLCGAIPYQKLGTYMGIFNFFIVLPQIVVSLAMGWIVHLALPGDPVGVMAIAAASFLIAASLAWGQVDG